MSEQDDLFSPSDSTSQNKIQKNSNNVNESTKLTSKEDITKIGFLDYDPENDSVNAIFIMNNHPSNYKFELEKILKKSKDSIFIFDGFGLLNKNQILAYESIRYSTLGYYDNGNINNES